MSQLKKGRNTYQASVSEERSQEEGEEARRKKEKEGLTKEKCQIERIKSIKKLGWIVHIQNDCLCEGDPGKITTI